MTSQPPAHKALLSTEEVLEALRKAGAIHDLMISDLNMPGMVNLRVAGYLTRPLRDSQVLEAAARALGAPAA